MKLIFSFFIGMSTAQAQSIVVISYSGNHSLALKAKSELQKLSYFESKDIALVYSQQCVLKSNVFQFCLNEDGRIRLKTQSRLKKNALRQFQRKKK